MAEGRALTCNATLEDVRLLAGAVQQFTEQAGVPDMARMDIELAVVEAANNIVLHGFPSAPGHTIDLEIRMVAGGVEVVLADEGIPIPDHVLADGHESGLDAEGGRGIGLIVACTDRIDYASTGGRNRLTLFKAVAVAAPDTVG